MADFHIQPFNDADKEWVKEFITESWGADFMIVHGDTYYPCEQPGFIAMQNGERVGLLTYLISGDACEVTCLGCTVKFSGIGTALLDAVKFVARQVGCRRLWLITTNDNIDALRFYQRRGFALVAVHRNALEITRRYKPIPLLGDYGIPLRDEIELEMVI